MAFYSALPFGWAGPPGFFAHISSDIPKWRHAHAPSNQENSGGESFSSFLFVEDGILIEPNIGTRCEESALCREKECEPTFGPDSVNLDKLGEEGNGGAKTGFVVFIGYGELVDIHTGGNSRCPVFGSTTLPKSR